MTLDELKATLKKLRRAKKKLDSAQAEYDALKDMCKDYMIEGGAEMLEVDGYKLSYVLVVSTSLDSKKLKEAMPEVWQRFSRMAESRRFTVTLPV